jgi:hypothetical protein
MKTMRFKNTQFQDCVVSLNQIHLYCTIEIIISSLKYTPIKETKKGEKGEK